MPKPEEANQPNPKPTTTPEEHDAGSGQGRPPLSDAMAAARRNWEDEQWKKDVSAKLDKNISEKLDEIEKKLPTKWQVWGTIAGAVTAFTLVVSYFGFSWDDFRKVVANKLEQPTVEVVKTTQNLSDKVKEIDAATKILQAQLSTMQSHHEKFASIYSNLVAVISDTVPQISSVGELSQKIQGLATDLNKSSSSLTENKGKLNGLLTALDGHKEQLERIVGSVGGNLGEFKETSAATKRIQQVFEEAVTNVATAQKGFGPAVAEVVAAQKNFTPTVAEVVTAQKEFAPAATAVVKAQITLSPAAEEIAKAQPKLTQATGAAEIASRGIL